MNEKLTYTIPEMAKALNISRNKAYELANTKGFPVFYVGRIKRIPIAALHKWLENYCNIKS